MIVQFDLNKKILQKFRNERKKKQFRKNNNRKNKNRYKKHFFIRIKQQFIDLTKLFQNRYFLFF